jgi:hypothetical protein
MVGSIEPMKTAGAAKRKREVRKQQVKRPALSKHLARGTGEKGNAQSFGSLALPKGPRPNRPITFHPFDPLNACSGQAFHLSPFAFHL